MTPTSNYNWQNRRETEKFVVESGKNREVALQFSAPRVSVQTDFDTKTWGALKTKCKLNQQWQIVCNGDISNVEMAKRIFERVVADVKATTGDLTPFDFPKNTDNTATIEIYPPANPAKVSMERISGPGEFGGVLRGNRDVTVGQYKVTPRLPLTVCIYRDEKKAKNNTFYRLDIEGAGAGLEDFGLYRQGTTISALTTSTRPIKFNIQNFVAGLAYKDEMYSFGEVVKNYEKCKGKHSKQESESEY